MQPGVVLDPLNEYLKRTSCGFRWMSSTSAQATLGGMAGNNSCGSRSIAYGNMVHNVLAIDAVPLDGRASRVRRHAADPKSFRARADIEELSQS